jgi:hypothetical protein
MTFIAGTIDCDNILNQESRMSKGTSTRQAAALTNLVGQIGCVTGLAALLVIGLAFGVGWLIDDLMGNERRIVTVVFLLGSFPITLYLLVKISLWFATRANEEVERLSQQDKDNTAI